MKTFLRRFIRPLLAVAQWLAAVTLVLLYQLGRRAGLRLCPPFLAVEGDGPAALDAEISASLKQLNGRLAKLDALEKAVDRHTTDGAAYTQALTEVKAELDLARKSQLQHKQHATPRHPGGVSEECARFLGGLVLHAGLGQDRFSGRQKEMAESQVKNLLGLHAKAALSTSDIPMPDEYSPDIVELVYQYGQGRKFATVFPLGALTVKLPKLTTDATFGLIAMSGTVTEVSPQIGFVTFTAQKFGGMIRLPSEIDEDSIVAMGQFLARHSARNIARVEDVQVFTSTGAGSGINGSAAGALAAAVTDSCVWNLGGSTTSGKTAISQATLADFRSLRNSSTLSGAVLRDAKYYLHPTLEALLVSFNTSATVTPYQRGTATTPPTLDGFPVEWISVMPAYSTSASVSTAYGLFGDVSYQYLGLRNGIRFDTSREAAFLTDEIMVRTIERLTVGYMATKAMAALQTSAS